MRFPTASQGLVTPPMAAGGPTIVIGWGLGVALLLLTIVAVAVAGFAELGVARQIGTASVRAVLQLAAVSVVVVAVVRSLWLSALFVGVMLAVAALTSARRMTRDRSGLYAVLPVALGAVPVVLVVVATGAVPVTGIALVPVCGIVIGGAMTATSQCGRRALDELAQRNGEYEAALSLGLRERDAAMLLTLPTAGQAMVPAMDQTRTVGLVTLPGAFVGVLIGLLAAEVIAVLVTAELVARGRIRRTVRSEPRHPQF